MPNAYAYAYANANAYAYAYTNPVHNLFFASPVATYAYAYACAVPYAYLYVHATIHINIIIISFTHTLTCCGCHLHHHLRLSLWLTGAFPRCRQHLPFAPGKPAPVSVLQRFSEPARCTMALQDAGATTAASAAAKRTL